MQKAGFPQLAALLPVFCGRPRQSAFLVPSQPRPGVDHGVRVQRDAVDTLIHQPFGQIGMVGRALAADAEGELGQVVLAVLQPVFGQQVDTARPSPSVRTKGTISCALVRPIDPLRDSDFFAQIRVELGALTSPDGTDLDPPWLHAELTDRKSWSAPFSCAGSKGTRCACQRRRIDPSICRSRLKTARKPRIAPNFTG
jgi:hypothetical protein